MKIITDVVDHNAGRGTDGEKKKNKSRFSVARAVNRPDKFCILVTTVTKLYILPPGTITYTCGGQNNMNT